MVKVASETVNNVFFKEFMASTDCCELFIISPWISEMKGKDSEYDLSTILDKINVQMIRTLVITRKPVPGDDWHKKAIELLKTSDYVQICYNDNLHAKIYLCNNASTPSFVLLGSSNLTHKSLSNHEIGLFLVALDYIEPIVDEIEGWINQLWGSSEEVWMWNTKRKKNPQCI